MGDAISSMLSKADLSIDCLRCMGIVAPTCGHAFGSQPKDGQKPPLDEAAQ